MAERFIILPNQIFYKKDVWEKILNNNIKEIILVEDIKYLNGNTLFITNQLAAMKLYEYTLKKLIKKLKLTCVVKYISATSKYHGDVKLYLNKISITGKTWMYRPTLDDNELLSLKPGGLPIELYSAPNYILSVREMQNLPIQSFDTFMEKIKHEIRNYSINDIVIHNGNNFKNYIKYGNNQCKKIQKKFKNNLVKKVSHDELSKLIIDPYNAMKSIDDKLTILCNSNKGKGQINYSFEQFMQDSIITYLALGILTPDTIISSIKTKHAIYSDLIINYLAKRDYLYYSYMKCDLTFSMNMMNNIENINKKIIYEYLNKYIENENENESIKYSEQIFLYSQKILKHIKSICKELIENKNIIITPSGIKSNIIINLICTYLYEYLNNIIVDPIIIKGFIANYINGKLTKMI